MKNVNIPIMIASLVLSILLWMVVYAQNVQMTPMLYVVKLNQDGLDTDRYIVTEIEELFRFTAAGPEDRLSRLKSEDLAAYVDLTEAVPGTREYPVKVIPEEIEEFVAQELVTRVTIEPLEQKTVPVKVEGQGKLENPNLRLVNTVVEPAEVVVTGAKSLVDKARQARVRLDLGAIDTNESTKTYTLSMEVLDSGGRPLEQRLIKTEPMFVRATPLLIVAPEEKMVFVAPIYQGQIAEGHASSGSFLEPKQVTIIGPGLTLAGITKIQTEPIDISGLTSTTTFRVKLKVPSGVIVKGADTVQVRVEVENTKVPETEPKPEEPGRTEP